MAQSIYFLKKLDEVGTIKATQKGNLSKNFVIELYHQFFSKERYARLPNREDDLPAITKLRHILDMSGLIKKRSNKFSLTKKGEKIIAGDKTLELFKLLVDHYFNKWNWGFEDTYPEFRLIQNSAVFNLYLLSKKAQEWILDKELGEIYLTAFPALVNEATDSYFSPEDQIMNSFCIRFLERGCLPMGLLQCKEEGKGMERKTYYKITPFFNQAFKFCL